MPSPKIGDPIPLGIVTQKDVINLGLGDRPEHAIGDQVSELRRQIAGLRATLADAGKTAARSVEEHPLLAITIVSLGFWALVGLGSRRALRTRR